MNRLDLCNCYIKNLSAYEQFVTRWGAHEKSCPTFRESRDPVDRRRDEEKREYHRANRY